MIYLDKLNKVNICDILKKLKEICVIGYGRLAQLVERVIDVDDVTDSNSVPPTFIKSIPGMDNKNNYAKSKFY